MAKVIRMRVTMEHTRFAHAVLRYRLLLLIGVPFIRFIPVEWLVRGSVEAEPVDE